MNFVIFATPRSGSSYLRKLIESCCEVKILHEPFNLKHVTWEESDTNWLQVLEQNKLDYTLDEIFKRYAGFKTLVFQLDFEQNNKIIDKCKTIFLERKNVLDAAVSSFISINTNIWQKWHSNARPFNYENFVLKEKDIVSFIEESRKAVSYKRNNSDFFYSTTYEKIYSNSSEEIINLFDFLNLKFDKSILEKMRSQNNKLNDPRDYHKIKNYDYFRKKFNYKNFL